MAEQIDIPTIKDSRGSLTVLEKLPFLIRRVYFLHGMETGATRGSHAQRTTDRVLTAACGSFEAMVYRNAWEPFKLDNPALGLRVKPMEWLRLSNFSEGAVCLVLASKEHDPNDTIPDFELFKRLLKPRSMCDCNQGRLPCTCERGSMCFH